MDIELPLVIRRQPDYTTCGPTSLHAVCRSFGDSIQPRRGRARKRSAT